MSNSTQQSIDIAGIKDGIVILKNGSYRLILQVSAINFSLKSEQEQTALIMQYQGFLNSLHFPIEIVVRSRRLDLGPYVEKMKKNVGTATNELISLQIQDYTEFITKLISVANIMKKTFYVVIPFDPISINQFNLFDMFFKKTQKFDGVKIPENEFKTHVEELTQRANIIASGLGGMGIHCFQLSSEKVIELFYEVYNPEESGKERLTDAAMLASPIVMTKDEMIRRDNNITEEVNQGINNADLVIEQRRNETAILDQQEMQKDVEKSLRSPENISTEKSTSQPETGQPEEDAPVTPPQNQEPIQ